MKLTNTKQQVKTVGSDVKEVAKATAKLGKDTFKIPFSFFDDIREHRRKLKEFYAWRDAQNTQQDPSNPQ